MYSDSDSRFGDPIFYFFRLGKKRIVVRIFFLGISVEITDLKIVCKYFHQISVDWYTTINPLLLRSAPAPGERASRPRENASPCPPLSEFVIGARSFVGLPRALLQTDHSNNSKAAVSKMFE